MKQFSSKKLFWILQLLSWGAFSLFLTVMSNLSEKWQGILIITLGNMVVFILMTSLLRWSLKKFAPIENFKVISILKIFIAVAITVLLLPTIAYYFGQGIGKILKLLFNDSKEIFNKPPDEINSHGKYIVYAIIIGGWTIFYYIIKLIRKSNTERIKSLQLKDEVKQAQLNTLKGHINPQFIFTALTNIKGLMLEDVVKSRAMLTTLSEMLRYSLTKNDINAVLLEEELEITKNYITLLTIEENKKFHITYRIASETLALQIPPLLLPNLLELATRYGILTSRKEETITFTSAIKNDSLKISVTHSGNIVLNKSRQTLESTLRQRLKLLYGNAVTFMTNHEIDKHEIWVVLPINSAKKNRRLDGFEK